MSWTGSIWLRIWGQWRALVNTVMNLRVPYNVGKFSSSCATGGFSRRVQSSMIRDQAYHIAPAPRFLDLANPIFGGHECLRPQEPVLYLPLGKHSRQVRCLTMVCWMSWEKWPIALQLPFSSVHLQMWRLLQIETQSPSSETSDSSSTVTVRDV
jgi:hypothetical protein